MKWNKIHPKFPKSSSSSIQCSLVAQLFFICKIKKKEKSIADKINKRQTVKLGSSLKAAGRNQFALSVNHEISPGSQRGINNACNEIWNAQILILHNFKNGQKAA